MTSCEPFLDTILPPEGLRCVAVFHPQSRGPRHSFFQTNREAAAFIAEQDALGRTVYHACATYKEPTHRRGDNVAWVRSFWLDCDRPLEEALPAAAAFIQATGLPKPTIVASGRGLHVYWGLDQSIPHDVWTTYARHLKQLCIKHKFCDRTDELCRTADVASILRPVGSHNRKSDPVLVRWSGVHTAYELRDLSFCQHGDTLSANRLSPNIPAHLQALRGKLNVSVDIPNEPSDADLVAANCAQIQRFKETRGQLTEPLWHAALGVVAYCTNGEEIAHAWSQGDPRYDATETQGKIDRANQLQGPTTCRYFEGLDPKPCAGCSHWEHISTPVQLGRLSFQRQFQKPSLGNLPPISDNRAGDLFGQPAPTLPKDFIVREDGLFAVQEENDGGNKLIKLCSYPLYLVGMTAREHDSEKHGFEYRYKSPRSDWRSIFLPADGVLGTKTASEFAARGIILHDIDRFRSYSRAAATDFQADHETMTIYEQYGWKDDETTFFVGDRLYTLGGVVVRRGVGEALAREKFFRPKGSLEKWSDAADKLFRPGCEFQGFSLLASFAAPFMRFHSIDEGGAVLSLSSRATAQGKSTALAAVTSVWGNQSGLMINNTATENARGITYAALGNLPIVFDEADQRQPDELRRFLEIFTSGRDRMRARAEGGMHHTPSGWQTVLICGSNTSMVDVVRAGSGSDAMAYRILELNAELNKDVEHVHGERLKRDLFDNAGHAGNAFLSYLTREPGALDWAKDALESERETLYTKYNFKREHRFRVRLMASIIVAGEIVKELGLVRFNPEPIIAWGIKRASEEVAYDGYVKPDGYEPLTGFLSDHQDGLIVVRSAYRAGSAKLPPIHRPRAKVIGRYETETGNVYLDKKAWTKWLVDHDYQPRQVFAHLESLYVALPNKMLTLVAGTDMPGGQVMAIPINGQKLGLGVEQKSGLIVMKGGKK